MGLYSSMRTADSLRDEESYFLAEIKKLQQIVQRDGDWETHADPAGRGAEGNQYHR